MTPLHQWIATAAIMFTAALFFFGVSIWCARKALRMAKLAAYHQQQAGELVPDALRWRLHLKDCAKGGQTAAQRQRAPVLAMAERLRGEFEVAPPEPSGVACISDYGCRDPRLCELRRSCKISQREGG